HAWPSVLGLAPSNVDVSGGFAAPPGAPIPGFLQSVGPLPHAWPSVLGLAPSNVDVSGGFAAPPGAPSPGSSRAWGPCPTPGRPWRLRAPPGGGPGSPAPGDPLLEVGTLGGDRRVEAVTGHHDRLGRQGEEPLVERLDDRGKVAAVGGV